MAQAAGGALLDFLRAPRSKYSVFGEAIRYVIPAHVQCSYGCGGPDCKYDNPTFWSEDQQAINGLYSSWVTDEILACSRPSTEIIEKYGIIDQFLSNGIKSLINLQTPGEHADCGNPLEPQSGFSYCPEVFMENDIYFYNFAWSDYGVGSLMAVLDMVKVMEFALQEGKVAIHCHAGLGRTGVLIACFIVYTTRMTANQAILYVRSKRPNSIQTRTQLRCVRQFVQFLVPLRSIFSCATPLTYPVTLTQYLYRQRHMLHGYERRQLRYLPKIVQLVCKLLIDIAENRQVIEEDILEAPDSEDLEKQQSIIDQLDPEIFNNRLPRLPGTPTLPRHFHEPPIFYHRKSLSYSESDLRRLGSDLNLLAPAATSLSQNDLGSPVHPSTAVMKQWNSNASITTISSTGSLWEVKNLDQHNGGIHVRRGRRSDIQRSESMGGSGDNKKAGMLARLKAALREELELEMKEEGGGEEEEYSEVPFITLQSELSLDARRLLVAQALAVDLSLEGEEQHKNKVLKWEAELNQGGAWEHLCLERDPFILTGLMWAWLEQLREPVISAEVARALDPKDRDPRTVLSPLDQGAKETVTCIMDCMAHMHFIPDKVERAFLKRAMKGLAGVQDSSPEGSELSKSLSVVLCCVLDDKRAPLIMAHPPRSYFSLSSL